MLKQKDSYIISLKLILKNKQGEILALKDASTGAFNGYYDLPGCLIYVLEYSVDLKDILMREVRKETGELKIRFLSDIPVAVGRHETLTSHTRIFYVFYEGEHEGGEVKISEEH